MIILNENRLFVKGSCCAGTTYSVVLQQYFFNSNNKLFWLKKQLTHKLSPMQLPKPANI